MHAFIPHNERNTFKPSRLFILLLILITTFYIHEGISMSLFFGEKNRVEAVLFSPLEGQLIFEGSPASEAKIKLWIKWKNNEGESFSYTADKNGFFKIPEQRATYKESALAQIVITQEITIEYKNEEHLIWTLSKTNTEKFGELGGEAQNLPVN